VITADGRLHGWIGGSCSEPVVRREALRALAEGAPQLVRIVPSAEVKQTRKRGELTVATTCPSGGALDIFIEPHLPKPLLLVFGETPAALTLARLAELTGFRARTVSQAEVGGLAVPGGDAWAVVTTMGHYDEDALEAALAHPQLDVALVASSRRAAAVKEALRGRGVDEATLNRIRTPAGKVRGATQEEIALLALAEVVTARRRRVPVAAAPVQPAVVFATDPVCGMTVDPLTAKEKTDYAGTTYWFCCAGCRTSFEAEPARYLRPVGA
jgi:xanthine dehydrogenase accessory factor